MPYTEYEILSDINIYEFTKKMNKYMQEGWQPSGNVNLLLAHLDDHSKVTESGGVLCIIYSQAIVK